MIICEVGLNHLGKEEYANHYIDEFLKTEAHAITFQVRMDSFFESEKFRSLKINKDFYPKAVKRIKEANRKVGIAIDDLSAVDFFEDLNVDFYKVLSKDISNLPLTNKLMEGTNKPLFVSTGMSEITEIETFCQRSEKVKDRITLIHTQLTHDINSVNLKAISSLHSKFDLPVAFGAHCSNLNVIYVSLAFSPSDIFIYIKGDRNLIHPDEEHSILLENLSDVAKSLIELPKTIGDGTKVKMKNWEEDKK